MNYLYDGMNSVRGNRREIGGNRGQTGHSPFFGATGRKLKIGDTPVCPRILLRILLDVTKFKKFHEAAGSTVKVFIFDTTPAQEAQIAARIGNHGGAGAFQCTTSVIDVLSGIGPFKNLKSTMWPGKFANQLVSISNGQ